MRHLLLVPVLAACGRAPEKPPTCDQRFTSAAAPTTLEELTALTAQVRAAHFPELSGTPLKVVELDSETDFFNANLDLATVERPPLKRQYLLKANAKKLFADGPSGQAFAAVVAHELKHIVDYTQKNSTDLVGFGLWYATADTKDYERATDEHALSLRCIDGLKAFRVWMYTKLTPDVVELRRRNYYTPEEIDAWAAAHPAPP